MVPQDPSKGREEDAGFFADQARLIRERSKIALLMGGFGFPLFFAADLLLYPAQSSRLFCYRLTVFVVCLTFYMINQTWDLGHRSFWLCIVGFYLSSFVMTLIIVETGGYRAPYYAGIILIIIGFTAVMAVPAWKIAVHLLLGYTGFLIGIFFWGQPVSLPYFFLTNLFILGSLGVSIIAAHANHRLRIREYRGRMELLAVRNQLERYSRSLLSSVTESETRYRQLVERMNDCLGVNDENGVVTYVNDRLCEVTGYPRKALLGRKVVDLVPPESYAVIRKEFEKRKRGIRGSYETAFPTMGGELLTVIVSSESMVDEKGRFRGSFAVITDISRQKRMEAALRATSERLRALLDANQDAVMLMDPDGRILDLNHSAARQMDGGVAGAKGMSVFSLVAKEVTDSRRPHVMAALRTGTPKRFEDTVKGRIYSNQAYPVVDEAGKVAAVAFYSRDITDMKAAERHIANLTHELLRALENERHRIARDLHDHVAQDLSSLRMECETLVAQAGPGAAAIRRQAVLISERIRVSIRDLREIAYALRPPDLDTLGLTQTIYRYCTEFSHASGIPVHFVSAGMESLARDFDTEINLYRLIQEALTNIRRHAGARQVEVRLVASHPDIIVRVEDDGMGFEAGKRGEAASSRQGMGLQSMAERVALLGGQFEIRSRSGNGCRIFVRVPIQKKEEGLMEKTEPSACGKASA